MPYTAHTASSLAAYASSSVVLVFASRTDQQVTSLNVRGMEKFHVERLLLTGGARPVHPLTFSDEHLLSAFIP
jgi:hypothetical protein